VYLDLVISFLKDHFYINISGKEISFPKDRNNQSGKGISLKKVQQSEHMFYTAMLARLLLLSSYDMYCQTHSQRYKAS